MDGNKKLFLTAVVVLLIGLGLGYGLTAAQASVQTEADEVVAVTSPAKFQTVAVTSQGNVFIIQGGSISKLGNVFEDAE